MADPKTRKEIEEAKALAEENIALLQTATDEMRKQSDLQKEQAKLTVENHNSNMELVKIAKEKGDFDAAREIELRSIGDVVASQAQVALATLSDAQAERLDAKRQSEQSSLKALEDEREASMKDRVQKKVKDKGLDKEVGKTPSFISKLAKLALGIVGIKVFQLMIENFDTIKAFVKDKIIPATSGLFTFFKDTVFPFISDNFKEIFNGMVMIAGAIVGFRIFTKILNAIRLMRIGFIAVQVGTLTAATNLSAMGKGVLAKLGTAIKFLRAGFLAVSVFTMSTLVPALTGIVTTMAVALAPFMPIILAVGVAIAGIAFLLNKVKNALGFDSIFDVMLLGLQFMKDGLAHVANFFIKIAKKIAGLGGKLLTALGIEVPDFVKNLENAELMDTNNAQRFKEETLAKQEAERLEKAKTTGTAESDIPEMPKMEVVAKKELEDAKSELNNTAQPELRMNEPPELQVPISMEKSGGFGSMLENLSGGREELESSKANATATQVAVQNISAPSTTNNSSSSVNVDSPSPATDDLDRVAYSW